MKKQIQTKEERFAERMAMPVLGMGTFVWGCKKHLTLPIVKMGKRDVTMRAEDGGLITLNKIFVEVSP
jgi:hypothetical protein